MTSLGINSRRCIQTAGRQGGPVAYGMAFWTRINQKIKIQYSEDEQVRLDSYKIVTFLDLITVFIFTIYVHSIFTLLFFVALFIYPVAILRKSFWHL